MIFTAVMDISYTRYRHSSVCTLCIQYSSIESFQKFELLFSIFCIEKQKTTSLIKGQLVTDDEFNRKIHD